uniref:Uncharacterized protein n=1 Tax=Anopheles quadriannulatus TaxID=34691 RepID=A0A182XTM2_ANOQN
MCVTAAALRVCVCVRVCAEREEQMRVRLASCLRNARRHLFTDLSGKPSNALVFYFILARRFNLSLSSPFFRGFFFLSFFIVPTLPLPRTIAQT